MGGTPTQPQTEDAGGGIQPEGRSVAGTLDKSHGLRFGMKNQSKGKRNYQREMEQVIDHLPQEVQVPKLFLHSCCAPCSSYVLETLSEFFEITVFYYNPNIYPEEEYRMRAREQQQFISRFPSRYPIHFLEGEFEKERFYEAARGLEQIPEGGERCHACFRLRLGETIKRACAGHFDYVTTTLTISPLKNAQKLNEIGEELCREASVRWLPSDFKKKEGYKRSTEISREYGMYRQNYCGCIFSMKERGLRVAQSRDQ